jgi:hypothetical protein
MYGRIKTAADREDVHTCSWSDNKGDRLYGSLRGVAAFLENYPGIIRL